MTAPTREAADGVLCRVMEELRRDLGPNALAELLRRFEPGKGDYTAERHKIPDCIDLADLPALLAELRSDGTLASVEEDEGS